MDTTKPDNDRLLTVREVCERVALKRTALGERIRAGTFRRPIHLSASHRAWSEREVSAWIEARKADRDSRVRE